MRRRHLFAIIIAATTIQGCTLTDQPVTPSQPVDEQDAKASSLAVLAEVQQAWSGLLSGWSSPDTLAYNDAGACVIVTSARTSGAGAASPSGMERLRPGFDSAVTRHGYSPSGALETINGSPVLRARRGDGRSVEFRGRSGDLDVVVLAHTSQCAASPRRI